jgi:hypothetical protein
MTTARGALLLAAATLSWTVATMAGPARKALAYDPLSWSTADNGGAVGATGGSYRLSGSIGRYDAGMLAGGGYVLRGGFWRGGSPAITGVEPSDPAPLVFRFRAPAPNPVRSRARLAFDLPAPAHVCLRVYDVSGRAVQTRVLGLVPAGRHELAWSADSNAGQPLPAGVYFMRFEAGQHRVEKKILVLP